MFSACPSRCPSVHVCLSHANIAGSAVLAIGQPRATVVVGQHAVHAGESIHVPAWRRASPFLCNHGGGRVCMTDKLQATDAAAGEGHHMTAGGLQLSTL